MKVVKGCISANTVFYTTQGDLDFDKTLAHACRLYREGVDAQLICSLTGEGWALDIDEHVEVVRQIAAAIGNDLPILAGVGSNNTREALELTRRLGNTQIAAFVAIDPYLNQPDNAGLYQYYKEIKEAAGDTSVIAYITDRSGATHSPVEALLKSGREGIIQAVAWSLNRNVANFENLIDVVQELSDYGVYAIGADDLFIKSSYAEGAYAGISVLSNLYPNLMSQLHAEIRHQEFDNAIDLFRLVYPIIKKLKEIGSNPVPIKAALSLAMPDIYGETPIYRSPLVPLSECKTAELKERLVESQLVNGGIPYTPHHLREDERAL